MPRKASWPEAIRGWTTWGLLICDLGESQQFSFPITVWQDPRSTGTQGVWRNHRGLITCIYVDVYIWVLGCKSYTLIASVWLTGVGHQHMQEQCVWLQLMWVKILNHLFSKNKTNSADLKHKQTSNINTVYLALLYRSTDRCQYLYLWGETEGESERWTSSCQGKAEDTSAISHCGINNHYQPVACPVCQHHSSDKSLWGWRGWAGGSNPGWRGAKGY